MGRIGNFRGRNTRKVNDMKTFLKGKKSYIIATLAGVGAAAQALGHPIPEYVFILLGAAGLGSVRAAIGR